MAMPHVLGANLGALSILCRALPSGLQLNKRLLTTDANKPKLQSLLLSHVTERGSQTPLALGFLNYFERHLPHVGYFKPIGTHQLPGSTLDKHVQLVQSVFNTPGDPLSMVGVPGPEAAKMIASRKVPDLLDRIYSAYASYKAGKDVVLMEGLGAELGGVELDAQIAQALSAPVLLTLSGDKHMTVNEYFDLAMLRRQVFLDHKVDIAGVALNQVPRLNHSLLVAQLKPKFEKEGLKFAGAVPYDALLGSVRLDEIQAALECEQLFGKSATLDKEFSEVVVASQRVEELLELLDERGAGSAPALVVTSQDRTDIVLGLLAAQVSVKGPTVAGLLLTKAGHAQDGRRYARDIVSRIFTGLEEGGGPCNTPYMPVLVTDKGMYDAMTALRALQGKPAMLPTSTRKIVQSKLLFDKYIDAEAVVKDIPLPAPGVLTPKMFTHNLKTMCTNNPQRIVLPEANDPRVLTAAAEVTQRGLAKVTLLGNPDTVAAEAKRLGLDLTGVAVHDTQNSDRMDKYVDALVEARKKKGLPRATALDMLKGDINMFGVMMVACGDADGMVSGALHTTAATIRPAMQVLRRPDNAIVSSVFFMCLPDKVLVFGDCAVNPAPNATELSQIAAVSADTAAAFGLEPRVAMLSYSTLGSGAGPDVQKVVEAVGLVKSKHPDVKVEGPIQYDAAIDPKVAAVKIKTPSEVAGKATVFIFPDLNAGNNTYKAVQQASGAIAMGPVMQGLTKPVNDLSRGCTVPDIINTICVTSIQAMQARQATSTA